MKLTAIVIVVIITLILAVFVHSRRASSHSGEKIAIYNLSGMMFNFAKQLDRIEALVVTCNSD